MRHPYHRNDRRSYLIGQLAIISSDSSYSSDRAIEVAEI